MKQESAVALRRLIEKERALGLAGKRAYSGSLKQRVLLLMKQDGWGPARVSRELGLASSVLYRWLRQRRERQRVVRKPSARRIQLAEVEIVAERGTRSFDLEFASGAKVTGLSLDDLKKLVGGGR
jgi:transposase-like protein